MRLVLLSLCCVCAFADSTPHISAKLKNALPIRFEPDAADHWRARGLGYSFLFTPDAAVMRIGKRTVELKFTGASPIAKFQGSEKFAAPSNYFIGHTFKSVPAYGRLHRRGLYPGIDLVYYGHGGEMEYDFEIAPGADPSRIRMKFAGADAVNLSGDGDVVLTLDGREVLQRAPVVYQHRESGEIVKVAASYRLASDGTVRVALGNYDRAAKLVVDPTITYDNYLTGSSTDWVVSVAYDPQGNIDLAGNTWSLDFPTTSDAFDATSGGNQDIWLMKLSPQNGTIVYCTYIGGAVNDTVDQMVIDANGVMYFTGVTASGNYPTTSTALQPQSPAAGQSHAFMSIVDSSQGGGIPDLVYSTYLGGSDGDEGDGITIANGFVYVSGWTTSPDFPTAGAYQPAIGGGCYVSGGTTFDSAGATPENCWNAFVVKIDPTQQGFPSEVYGTFLGGSTQDLARSVAVDASGNIYVTGVTYDIDFPLAGNSVQSVYGGQGDVFVVELNPGAGTLLYSTYLGGAGIDEAKKILLDPSGRAVLTGYTTSPDFLITQGAYQTAFGGTGNAFLSIIDLTQGTLAYSTFFGGSGGEVAYDMHADSAGRYYLSGYTMSANFPVTANALNPTSAGGAVDGFIAVLDPSQPPFSPNALVYSSYVTSTGYTVAYGNYVDSTGAIYVGGVTTSNVFPPGYMQNAYVLKQSGFILIFTLQNGASDAQERAHVRNR
jgi:Beta-propeller repeat